MSLSSRPPVQATHAASGSSSLSDALSAFNFSHYANSVLSNSIVAGVAQYLDVDSMFGSNAGENMAIRAIKEGAWTASVSQIGTMTRQIVPYLRVF